MKNELKDLLHRTESYADSYGMLDCNGIVVGYSGGSDSSLLLAVLSELSKKRGFSLYAAHINHMLRGDEADSDEAFCRRTCERLGVRFFSKKTDVAALARSLGQSDEQCARDVRYSFFEEIRRGLEEKGERVYIATAHNATDNAETLIFNITRGSTLSGMCAIPPIRDGHIIRPLLWLSKAEVEEYCHSLGIEFVTDRTNQETLYTRNKIRHKVLGVLREINPSLETSVFRACESARADAEHLDREAARAYEAARDEGGLSRESLVSLDGVILSRVLCKLFEARGAGYENVHINACIEKLRSGGDFSISLIGKKKLCAERDIISVKDDTREKKESPAWIITLKEGENDLGGGAFIYLFSKKEDAERIKTQNVYKLFIQQTLSGDTINNVFCARLRRAGDVIFSGGHTHKIKKLLSDKKIPLSERDRLPVVLRDELPVWIPGVRAADGEGKDKERHIYAVYAIDGGHRCDG